MYLQERKEPEARATGSIGRSHPTRHQGQREFNIDLDTSHSHPGERKQTHVAAAMTRVSPHPTHVHTCMCTTCEHLAGQNRQVHSDGLHRGVGLPSFQKKIEAGTISLWPLSSRGIEGPKAGQWGFLGRRTGAFA